VRTRQGRQQVFTIETHHRCPFHVGVATFSIRDAAPSATTVLRSASAAGNSNSLHKATFRNGIKKAMIFAFFPAWL
jgi:hypothetical protein